MEINWRLAINHFTQQVRFTELFDVDLDSKVDSVDVPFLVDQRGQRQMLH